MISMKYIAILLLIGSTICQTTTPATATPSTTTPTTTTPTTTTPTTTTPTTATPSTTTPTTTTPTVLPVVNMNKCGIAALGSNKPSQASECTGDTSKVGQTCCLLTATVAGANLKMCDLTATAGMIGDYKSIVKQIINAANMTYVDYDCNAAYLSFSAVLFFVAALLF